MDIAQLQELLQSMEKERRELMKHINSLMWYMRGGLSREEAWSLSPEERKSMLQQIEERVKTTEKSGMALL